MAIALDTKGPEIRTGMVPDNGLSIEVGHEMVLSTDEALKDHGSLDAVYVDYPQIGETLAVGALVYVDDGNLQLRVEEPLGSKGVRVKALNAHRLLSKKGVNLPYSPVVLPALSEKDRADLGFAVKHQLDMIFASFIRKAEDIEEIRKVLGEAGKNILVIAKIENHEGVCNFDEILQAADGIMVARGDLGIEIPPEKVFLAQKMMIARSNMVGKPVICATQMLESMTANPRPTRAEASDVANAILDGADCVMLSAETARGLYPTECVSMMSRIVREAESTIAYLPLFEELKVLISSSEGNVTQTVATSAVNASLEPHIWAIICLTGSGDTARQVAKFRPQVPILAITRVPHVARQLHLHRGCYPMIYEHPQLADWQTDVEERIKWAMSEGKRMGLLRTGQHVVIIQGNRAGSGFSNTLRIIAVS